LRFIHTADWHLGRLFHGVHLTDDQAHVLDQFVALCRELRPDVVVVAGDIYDRAVPPPEAVELLDDVLCRLVLDVRTPVVMIAGNHDSPGRLHFAARLLHEQRLHVRGTLSADLTPIVFHDADGPVLFHALPYAEPAVVQQCLAMEPSSAGMGLDHCAAMRALTARLRADHQVPGARSVLVAHAFVTGGEACESERPLSVGNAGLVDAACFDGFDYVALGHLHRPQTIAFNGDRTARYSGSLLKYSFDEADHAKSVTLVDMDARGACACETFTLTPRREVRRIAGLLGNLLREAPADIDKDDYLEVTLLDDGPVLDAVGRLREVYPNVAELKREGHRANEDGNAATASARLDHRKMTELELFRAFYQHVAHATIEDPQALAFSGVIEAMRRAEREACTFFGFR
jgi:exonuclease SbcD